MSDDALIVLALKSLDHAKSRLAGAMPLGSDRSALVTAMFADTVDAVRRSGRHTIVVVSPDARVLALAAQLDVQGIVEPATTAGLNEALVIGARHPASETAPIAYLQADLPALQPDSLCAALDEARPHPAAFVADHSGSGTALLVVQCQHRFAPAFGLDSARAHRERGAVELDPERHRWPDLRRDVDTPADLQAAHALGLGIHTAALGIASATDDGARERCR